jgi:hypothetical protein
MEKLNGRIQKVSGRSKKQALDMGRTYSHTSSWYLWLILACTLSIAGCSFPKIKTALITGAATSAAVGVTSVVAPGVLVPAAIGGTTAAIASALTADQSVNAEPISVTADTVVNKAPDNFFTLLGKLVGMGGWLLGLVLLLPMVLGWIIPGPLTTHKKKKKS